MDPKIAKKTQETLGKIIKKPPLTDKLLGKPPFRFLHDVMTSVIKTTGFMQGLFTETEMNSENVKDKEAKIAFLQKAIDMVSAVTGKDLSVKPVKVVAGHEPERTNEFLQVLAEAINKNVDSDEYVRKVLKGGKGGAPAKEEKKERDREKREERKKEPEPEVKDRLEKEELKREENKERGNHESERKRDKDRDRKHERDRDRHKDRDKERDRDRHKEKDSKTQDKSKEGQEEKQREKEKEKSKRREHSREKERESPDREKMNGETEEKHDHPARLQRPSSAKGSRRRRERRASHDPDGVNEDDDDVAQKPNEPMLGEGDLPPQVVAARQLARPSSARPAPPRPKHEVHESEPAMRLGSGQPTNVIADDDNDDEDENFLVQETAAPPPEPDIRKAADEADTEHGALVQKMLESKKEAEKGKQGPAKKTEIERSLVSDAQRRKQREAVQKEVDKLRTSIQNLTRNANPLGKVMDYVQEDMDSMQQELEKWRTENAQHALDLKREMNVTDRAIDPLRQQLADVDRAITDQLDQIATIKSNIIKNDQKIQKMLRGISSA